jgi:hypothetical protein
LGASSSHELVKELHRSRWPGYLKGDEPTIRLDHYRKPQEPTATALRINHASELGEESVGRRERPTNPVAYQDPPNRPRDQSW